MPSYNTNTHVPLTLNITLVASISDPSLSRQKSQPPRPRRRRRRRGGGGRTWLIVLGRVLVSGAVCWWLLGEPKVSFKRQFVAQERPELSVLEVRAMVFHEKYYAAPHEPRVWRRKEDPVHDLSEAIPSKVESGAAHKATASRMIGGTPWGGQRCGKDVPKFAGGVRSLWIVVASNIYSYIDRVTTKKKTVSYNFNAFSNHISKTYLYILYLLWLFIDWFYILTYLTTRTKSTLFIDTN